MIHTDLITSGFNLLPLIDSLLSVEAETTNSQGDELTLEFFITTIAPFFEKLLLGITDGTWLEARNVNDTLQIGHVNFIDVVRFISSVTGIVCGIIVKTQLYKDWKAKAVSSEQRLKDKEKIAKVWTALNTPLIAKKETND
jgi:hypothetical protein